MPEVGFNIYPLAGTSFYLFRMYFIIKVNDTTEVNFCIYPLLPPHKMYMATVFAYVHFYPCTKWMRSQDAKGRFFTNLRTSARKNVPYQIARGLRMPVQICITMFCSVPTLLGILSLFVQIQSSLRDLRCLTRHLNKFCGMKGRYTAVPDFINMN
jgi:hypothetical protein